MIRNIANAANLASRRKDLLGRRIMNIKKQHEDSKKRYFSLLDDPSTTPDSLDQFIEGMRSLERSMEKLTTEYARMNNGSIPWQFSL